jgi:hypothetical protein
MQLCCVDCLIGVKLLTLDDGWAMKRLERNGRNMKFLPYCNIRFVALNVSYSEHA